MKNLEDFFLAPFPWVCSCGPALLNIKDLGFNRFPTYIFPNFWTVRKIWPIILEHSPTDVGTMTSPQPSLKALLSPLPTRCTGPSTYWKIKNFREKYRRKLVLYGIIWSTVKIAYVNYTVLPCCCCCCCIGLSVTWRALPIYLRYREMEFQSACIL